MRKNWILPFANLLCLIHCVGMGLLSASAPIWLSGLHLEWLEYCLLGFNLVVGVKVFKSLPIPKYRLNLLVAGLAISFVSLTFDHHSLYHWCVALTAVYQITTLIQFHNKKNHDSCTCELHIHSPLSPAQKAKNLQTAHLINQWQNEPLEPEADKNWAEFEKDLNANRFNIPDKDEE